MEHWKETLFIILGIIILLALGAIYFYFGS